MLKRWRKLTAFLLVTCILVTNIHGVVTAVSAQEGTGETGKKTPMEKYGTIQIAVDEATGYNQLCDENGNPIQLKGMSTFGLQWDDGNWVLNEAAFDALAYDWKCDIIRLAMYVAEDGYSVEPTTMLQRVEKGIELATERGMYVLVDWHMLNPGNPTNEVYLNAGKELEVFAEIREAHPDWNGPQLFFAYLSDKYGSQGNVLFESANEPNGLGGEADAAQVWEEKLLPYHKGVVEAIRTYDADDVDNIVVLGTDNWSQFVDAPATSVGTNNVEQDVVNAGGIPQIMYTIHFYAGTHDTVADTDGKYWLGEKVLNALKSGQAVFCTEWGTSEATGDGGPYINNSDRWLDFFDENKISWCSWSLAKKNEISAAMLSTTPENPKDNNGDGIPDWTSEELSVSGNYVRAKIRGEEVPISGSSESETNMEDAKYIAKFSAKSTKIQKGKSSTALASDLTITAGDKVKEWSTSKNSIVSVDKKTGKIKAKKVGTAVVTVTTEKGMTSSIIVKVVKKKVKTTKVVVKNKITDKKLKNKSTVTLKNKSTLWFKTVLTPVTSPEKVTYKSSNKKIATVSSKGKITAKKKGKATITVKSGKKTVKITVKVK